MCEGQLTDEPRDDRVLGCGLFQKFQAGRDVKEQPADADPCPRRTPGRTRGELRAALDQPPVSLSPIARPAYRFYSRDRGNACQGLASEAKSLHGSQVLE